MNARFAALVACAAACAPGASVRPAPADPRVTAFVDVTVIPMDREGLLPHQTVVVDDGRIVAVGGAGGTPVPQGAQRIDGRGKFLVPGLADMHAHTVDEASRFLFVSMGVTTIRIMAGGPSILRLRAEVRAGRQPLSPWIYTAGPILDGDPPIFGNHLAIATPARGAEVVHAEKRAGYDFIKVYENLSLETYDAIVAAARQAGLPVTGHVPGKVGVAHAVESGQVTMEHLDGYTSSAQRAGSTVKPPDWRTFLLTAHRSVDEAKLADLIARVKAAGAWTCPTLVVDERMANADRLQAAGLPELRYLPPVQVAGWDPKKDFLRWTPEEFEVLRGEAAWNRALVGRLVAAGARLLAGTDVGNPWVVPGFSLHDELELLVRAGLTPYQALRAATAAPAELFGAEAEAGTVRVGRRADLVLLDADPQVDVSRTRQIAGVMVRGRWLPRAELERRREELAAVYRGERSRFAGRPPISAAPAAFQARFRNLQGAMLVGEERLAVKRAPDGTFAAVGEQRLDTQPETRVDFDLGAGEAGVRLHVFRDAPETKRVDVTLTRAGGRAKLSGTLSELDQAESFDIDEPLADDELLAGPGLVADLAWMRRLAALGPGESATLKLVVLIPRPKPRLQRLVLQVTRAADATRTVAGRTVKVRVYAVDDSRTKWTVALDEAGWPVETAGAVRAE